MSEIKSTVVASPAIIAKKKKKSKKKKIIWISIIAVILLVIIAVVVSGKKEKVIEVQTEKVKRQNIIQVVTATGKVQAETKVVISAEVSGEIVALPFKEGESVKKGELVVKIRPDAYLPRINMENAGIKVAESNLKSQEVNMRKNLLELNRIKELQSKGLASQSDLDNAQANYDAVIAQMNTVRAQVTQQRASLSSVQYDLSKTTINAPMSGTITQLNNELGEKVLGTSYNIGSQILTISDLSSMECQVEVGETDVTLVNIGDTARIQIDAFPDKVFNGYVYEIANTATSKGTGTQEEVVNFIVKIRINNEADLDLRPGMSCTVDIEVEKKDNVIAVPIQSVTTREEEGLNMISQGEKDKNVPENLGTVKDEKISKKVKPKEIVFITENGVAKKKEVKTGISNDTYIEITGGLEEDVEVVKGSFKAINKDLEEDTKVKISNEKKMKPQKE
ncbi:MAG: efflux RND transporter periplasmic adaptor subunit [Ignavibacteriae bacterium]|nr:efflux RND transporter periplasmic adaptor subunit [Ignavibacteriota bacterium]